MQAGDGHDGGVALILVDVLKDFTHGSRACTGSFAAHGAVAVPGAQEILAKINALICQDRWDMIIVAGVRGALARTLTAGLSPAKPRIVRSDARRAAVP